ncbi:MAG: methyltransferase family protein [Candidatus Levyibacteriota bacterium]
MHAPAIFHLPLAIPFWVIFFLAFVREGRVVRPALAEKSSAQDAGSFRALMIGSPLSMLLALAASFLPWLRIPGPTIAVACGMALIVAGAVLRRHCFRALSTSFTGVVRVREGQEVIQTGPYRLVRHPSYTAAFMMYVGVGLALESWISVGILFLAHCYLYGRRVVAEERALVATLGDAYAGYMQRTKRFIPFVI